MGETSRYEIKDEGMNLAFTYLGEGEAAIKKMTDEVYERVVCLAAEVWKDDYGFKLIKDIDDLNTEIQAALVEIEAMDVNIKRAANILKDPSGKVKTWREASSLTLADQGGN